MSNAVRTVIIFCKPICLVVMLVSFCMPGCNEVSGNKTVVDFLSDTIPKKAVPQNLDTADYDFRMQVLANEDSTGKWPVKGPYPLAGAILPFQRIIAFYGNLYSKNMGILGELPSAKMLEKLQQEVKTWDECDPAFKAMPALHYIAVTAQPEGDKKRLRMPSHQIDSILNMAKKIEAIVFLDIQLGRSTLQEELPRLEKYFKMPQVHLGIDPEFALKTDTSTFSLIGTLDAIQINFAIDYLAKVVKKYNLPPKIIVVHRFTNDMLSNAYQIKKVQEVQIVINMDGFGSKELKRSTYQRHVYSEPVQFTGMKLFYKNDSKADKHGLLTPDELMEFVPRPIYIQYH